MLLQMKEDIKKARERAKWIVDVAGYYGEEYEFIYNSLVKLYLRGYNDALKNAATELKDE